MKGEKHGKSTESGHQKGSQKIARQSEHKNKPYLDRAEARSHQSSYNQKGNNNLNHVRNVRHGDFKCLDTNEGPRGMVRVVLGFFDFSIFVRFASRL